MRASEREHADLFWGIRGGGGNFGIVTEFEFRLHPLGPIVLAGLAMFPIGRAPDVLRRWRNWSDGAPDELSTGCAVILAPPEEFVPPELRGQPVLGIPVLYVGDPEAGAAVVQPLGPRPRRGQPRRPDALHRLPGGPRPARAMGHQRRLLRPREVHGRA